LGQKNVNCPRAFVPYHFRPSIVSAKPNLSLGFALFASVHHMANAAIMDLQTGSSQFSSSYSPSHRHIIRFLHVFVKKIVDGHDAGSGSAFPSAPMSGCCILVGSQSPFCASSLRVAPADRGST
jgi:hypothetical protein